MSASPLMTTWAGLLFAAGLFLAPTLATAQGRPSKTDPIKVDLSSPKATKGPLTGQLFVPPPASKAPAPVVVALHGCGGLLTKSGAIRDREADWAARWTAAGYAVLFPDSFNPRGFSQICTAHQRQIGPQDRADDVAATLDWIATRKDLDADRVALVGWSHGAMTTLWALRPMFLGGPVLPKLAIAFYPGCREIAKLPGWAPSIPLTILSGALDDWTNPKPCRDLAARTGVRMIEYPEAYHDFDAPNIPLRERRGISSLKSGTAHIGTNPEARAAAITEVTAALATALKR